MVLPILSVKSSTLSSFVHCIHHHFHLCSRLFDISLSLAGHCLHQPRQCCVCLPARQRLCRPQHCEGDGAAGETLPNFVKLFSTPPPLRPSSWRVSISRTATWGTRSATPSSLSSLRRTRRSSGIAVSPLSTSSGKNNKK